MNKILYILGAAFLAGCGSIASIGTGAGAMPVHQRPTYNSPQQVIYRIDEHRYITLENYRDCQVGGIMKWHDERKSLQVVNKKYPTWGAGVWQGQFYIEPGEERFAIPSFGCDDKGCLLWINFTNDGGKSWDAFPTASFSHSYFAPHRNRDTRPNIEATEVRVTREGYIYVIPQHRQFYYRYHLDGTKDQYPKGTSTGDERCWPENSDAMSTLESRDLEEKCNDSRSRRAPFPPLPPGKYDRYDLASIPKVKTPSGQERFTCDPSLNPVITDDE